MKCVYCDGSPHHPAPPLLGGVGQAEGLPSLASCDHSQSSHWSLGSGPGEEEEVSLHILGMEQGVVLAGEGEPQAFHQGGGGDEEEESHVEEW